VRPDNHENDVARLCAVLRSWEDRFGIRLLALSYDRLTVSVSAPPRTLAEAEAIAVEHYAFSPDTIDQTATPSAPTRNPDSRPRLDLLLGLGDRLMTLDTGISNISDGPDIPGRPGHPRLRRSIRRSTGSGAGPIPATRLVPKDGTGRADRGAVGGTFRVEPSQDDGSVRHSAL